MTIWINSSDIFIKINSLGHKIAIAFLLCLASSIWDNQNVSSLKKEKYNLKNVSHFSVNPKYNPLMERMTDKRLKLLLLL